MNRVFVLLFIILAFITHGSAQSYLKTDIGIKTSINNTDYEIQFFSPSIVRVIKMARGIMLYQKSLSVIKSLKEQNLISTLQVKT